MRRFNLRILEIPFNPFIRFVLRIEDMARSEIGRVPWSKIVVENTRRRDSNKPSISDIATALPTLVTDYAIQRIRTGRENPFGQNLILNQLALQLAQFISG
jgi:hypothetical protein